ncbi:MAG TPA: hypothetical protein DCY79_05055, partial [Planctomycetaceae bacterium]|nr:hypothetical protein [Planctomycetaceae bacterium]
HQDDFSNSFASAVLEYGMGRALGFSDQPFVAHLSQHAKTKNYAIRSYIHALVQHEIFQQK